MFFICRDDEVSLSVAKKFAREAKPGAMIPLTNEEFDAYRDFELVSTMESGKELIEIKPDTMYMMIINAAETNIDDIKYTNERIKTIGSEIRVVRNNQ